MKLILNENLEFEVSRKPKLSGDPIQIPLEDVSNLPEVITGDVILQDMIVWPTQETVAEPVIPEVVDEQVEGEEFAQEEIPGYSPEEEPEAEEPVIQEPVVVEPQPEPFVLWRTTAEQWLRYYVNGDTLCFTNIPVPAEPDPEEVKEQLAQQVRSERDARIAETDWTQVLDAPITAECRDSFRVYRQALRDVPQQAGFPFEVIWPEMPEVVKAVPDPVDTALEILVGGDE